MLPAILWSACSGETQPTKPIEPESEPSSTGTPTPETTPTGDTGEPSTSTWTGLFPLVPFDCDQPLPPGPLPVSFVSGVLTTEDFTIDPAGWLVASDWEQNLLRFDPAGNGTVFVPNAAETRGIEVLPDGDLVISDDITGQIVRVATDGTITPIGSAGNGPTAIDVASDGTVYVGDLNGGFYEILPDGTVTDLGPLRTDSFAQTYGVALSIDEQTLYASQYNGNGVYRLMREGDGWGESQPWVTVDGNGLAGMAVDACENLYVIASFGCRIFRVTPAGEVELLAELDVPDDYCPNLGFGRDVGGWDPFTLYVSTYHTLAALPVGVPGKPR
jgi:sugar lactone lactonase YvrE